MFEQNEWYSVSDDALYTKIIEEGVRQQLVDVYEEGGVEALKTWSLVQEVRRRCEQELWWLGKYFLWDTSPYGAGRPLEESTIKEHVHRRVCDLFIRKDKNKKIGEQDWRKERLILYPRGAQKSSWDRYDVVQWVLNFPDIRILYLTAETGLAEGFVGETKSHFLWRPDDPSLMNLFFPEYCFLEKDSGPVDQLICPLWAAKKVKRNEPTVWGSSVESTLSGKHFELIKIDDAVSDENSQNEIQCKKIRNKVNLKRKMLLPTGYADKIGTRYADEDMYGEDMRANVGNIKREGYPTKFSSENCAISESNWEILDNLDTGLRILVGRSIVIKPEVAEQLERDGKPVTYKEAGKEGCSLLFPEHHPFEWCMFEYSKNEQIFEGQQNQNPRSATTSIFDRALLMKHTIPYNDPKIPQTGPITQTWDFAFSTKKGRDYSTAACAVWNPNRQCIILDLIRAKFTPTGLAKAVVDFAVKYRPCIIGIEKAGGSEMLAPTIMAEALKTRIQEVIDVCSRIDWFTPSNQEGAKITKMAALHPWLMNDLMFFVSHLPFLEILYDEFERCLTSKGHNDIPDVIAQQPVYAPRAVQMIDKQQTEMFSRSDGNWHMVYDVSGEMYGQGFSYYRSPFQGWSLQQNADGELKWVGDEIPNPIVSTQPEPEVSFHVESGLDPVLGALNG